MKQENINIPIEIYESDSELSETDRRLLARAKAQVEKAYAPYSRFKVGVALLLANGEIVTGNNVENAAYPMCLCAEQAAIGAASARFPEVPILSLAVTIRHERKPIDQPAGPCGSCRQVISEAEDRHQQAVSIIMRGTTGPIYKVRSAKDLLPISFSGAFL
jgi:cytidine deaminase